MTAEIKRPETSVILPTPLGLFECKGGQRVKLLETWRKIDSLGRGIFASGRAVDRYVDETMKSVNRLDCWAVELVSQVDNLRGSETIGRVYLKLREELLGLGAEEQEVLGLFTFLIKTNNKFYHECERKNLVTKGRLKDMPGRSRVHQEVFSEVIAESSVPAWFDGGRVEWRRFCLQRSFFMSYITGEDALAKNIKDGIFRTNDTRHFPDWYAKFVQDAGDVPQISDIMQELAEDEGEIKGLVSQLHNAGLQRDTLRDTCLGRVEKANHWIDKRYDSIREVCVDFPTFLLSTDTLVKVERQRAEYLGAAELERQYGSKVARQLQNPEEYYILRFCNNDSSIFCRELVAVYVENIISRVGILGADRTISSEAVEIFTKLCFDDKDCQEYWRRLKEQDRKRHAPLYYDLRALFSYVPDEGKSFLIEFLKECYGESADLLVFTVADLLVQYRDNIPGFLSQESRPYLKPALSEFAGFARRWVRKNWKWAHGELVRSLGVSQKLVISRDNTIAQESSLNESGVDVVADLDIETYRVSQGALSNWQIFYLTNLRGPDQEKYRILIPGVSIADREQNLKSFMVHAGVTSPEMSGSIVRMLEGLVNLPENVVYLKPKYKVGEEEYIKLKRDAVRVLCKMYKKGKTLLLHVKHRGDKNYLREEVA